MEKWTIINEKKKNESYLNKRGSVSANTFWMAKHTEFQWEFVNLPPELHIKVSNAVVPKIARFSFSVLMSKKIKNKKIVILYLFPHLIP